MSRVWRALRGLAPYVPHLAMPQARMRLRGWCEAMLDAGYGTAADTDRVARQERIAHIQRPITRAPYRWGMMPSTPLSMRLRELG